MKSTTVSVSFDVLAEAYHHTHPGYPAMLYDDIREFCGIGRESQLLEMGAGGGNATTELAKLGGRILAVEPNGHLAAIAKKQTEGFPNVEIIEGSLENLEISSPGRFDVVLAFIARHWVDQGIGSPRVRKLLRDTGSLVLVWNSPFFLNSSATVEMNRIHQAHLPDARIDEPASNHSSGEESSVQDLPLHPSGIRRCYYTAHGYNGETYPKLLDTFPKVLGIPEESGQGFFAQASEIVEKHGTIVMPVLTTLVVYKKAELFPDAT
jgi:SAM-dependent methyltransferase